MRPRGDAVTPRQRQRARSDPGKLAIRADSEAPWGQEVKVMDKAKAANIKVASAFIRSTGEAR